MMGTEIFKIDASWAEKLTKTRVQFLLTPTVNEILPTIYGPNKPKTLGKPLRILDLQTPASYHDKPATL